MNLLLRCGLKRLSALGKVSMECQDWYDIGPGFDMPEFDMPGLI